MNILIAGESWTTHTIHIKGFDTFTTSAYEEGVAWLRAALEKAGHQVHFLPNHQVSRDFPTTTLDQYDALILSDCGSNTLLLHPDTFVKSERSPNRLAAIYDYVAKGGGLVMIGGYMSFQGIDGKARYHHTPVEEALPVLMQASDDRVEVPEGMAPTSLESNHPVLRGIEGDWPAFLGYNRFSARPEAHLLASIGDDPFLVVWEHHAGRAAAFASDCGPHWGPQEYLSWKYHDRFWAQLVSWVAKES